MSPLNITQPLGIWSINVYNGYYKVMSNIPKMGHLPTPGKSPWKFITSPRRNASGTLAQEGAAGAPQQGRPKNQAPHGMGAMHHGHQIKFALPRFHQEMGHGGTKIKLIFCPYIYIYVCVAYVKCFVEFCSSTINIDINRYGDINQKLMVPSTQVRILQIENWDKLGSSCELLGWTFKNI